MAERELIHTELNLDTKVLNLIDRLLRQTGHRLAIDPDSNEGGGCWLAVEPLEPHTVGEFAAVSVEGASHVQT